MTQLTLLCELARKYETDKGGAHYRYGGGDSDTCHNYTPAYHELFGGRRGEVKHVLEIGVNAGSSLRMWREYFPQATIRGIDSNSAALVHGGDRITCHAADQNNAGQLIQVMDDIAATYEGRPDPFDFIVDDGSHEVEHQIVSMKALLQYLSETGVYVVEDIGQDDQARRAIAALATALPDGFSAQAIDCKGGLGKAEGCEWLFAVRRGNWT